MSKKNRTREKKAEPVPESRMALPRGWVVGLILVVTFLAFSNSLTNGFAYDDTTQILENKFIRDLRHNLPKALVTETWYWRIQQDKDPNKQEKPSSPYYRPVFTVYLMVGWKLWYNPPPAGLSEDDMSPDKLQWAGGWHVLNLLLHLIAVCLVFLVCERIAKDLRVSAIASLVFAVHPLRSESVAWISGLTDPLLAVFLVSSLYAYVRYREEGKVKLLAGSLALFTMAAFTKEPAVALPIFIGAYELFIVNQERNFRERLKPAIKYSASFLVISALYLAARYYALGFALNNADFKSYPLYQVFFTIPLVIWKYIGLLLWPIDLSVFHATYMVESALEVRFILPVLGLIGLAYGLWRLRGSIVARFAILWFFINLLPVLNLSAFGEDFLVQERYAYIPSIGFSLFVAMWLIKIPIEKWLPFGSRRTAQTAMVGVLVFLLAGKSLAQNTAWENDMAVWIHGAEMAPDQRMPHYVLGHKLLNQGEYAKAAQELEEYLKLKPDNLIVISNLASAYLLIYQYQVAATPTSPDRAPLDRALELCEKGLSIRTDLPTLWDTLGGIHTSDTGLKNYDRAIACFQRALSFNPENPMMTFHLGGTLVKKGSYDEGMRYLKEALDQAPNIVDAHKFLAQVYKAKGNIREAINELDIYLQLQPNAPDASRISKDLQDMRARLQQASPQG